MAIELLPVTSTPVTSIEYDIPLRVPPEEGEKLQNLVQAQSISVEEYLGRLVGPNALQSIQQALEGSA